MKMFSAYMDKIIKEIKNGHSDTFEGTNIRFIGDMSVFNEEFRR